VSTEGDSEGWSLGGGEMERRVRLFVRGGVYFICVCVLLPSLCKGIAVPVRGGGQRCRTAARSTRPHALQAPSAAHHALPVSGQSSVVYVPLCRCVSCALCENLRAPNRTPHPSRCALPAARCLHL
jgi:hypothetical protein